MKTNAHRLNGKYFHGSISTNMLSSVRRNLACILRLAGFQSAAFQEDHGLGEHFRHDVRKVKLTIENLHGFRTVYQLDSLFLLSLSKMPPGKLPLNLTQKNASMGSIAAKNKAEAIRTHRGVSALIKSGQCQDNFPYFSGENSHKFRHTHRIVMNGRRTPFDSVRFVARVNVTNVTKPHQNVKCWYECAISRQNRLRLNF
jgi:hypothetical protein